MNDLAKRKRTRMKDYDYSQNGAYFITICTKDRLNLLCTLAVGADDPVRPPNKPTQPHVELSEIGQIVDSCPSGGQGRPPLQKIVQGFKSVTTRLCFPLGYRIIWQRSFHDHIIRSQDEYRKIRNYIDENPQKWLEDCHSVDENLDKPHGFYEPDSRNEA